MMQEGSSIQGFNRRKKIDKIIKVILLITAMISASVVILVVIQIAERGLRPLFVSYDVSVFDSEIGEMIIKPMKLNFFKFITGTRYYAPIYQIGYIIVNTLFITFITILIATPISVLSALFIVKMAPKWLGSTLTTVVEMLAAVPSIIYGMFGMGYISSITKSLSIFFTGKEIGIFSLLTTIIVLVMMILPTITTMSITAIKSVKNNIEHGSLALGASETQTHFKVTLVAAKSGIFAGIILAVGRALGEATAVSLVSGNAGSGPNFNLFDTTRTLTSTILLGIKETGGFDYDVRFTVGLALILIIFITNATLNMVKRRMSAYEA